MLDAGGLEAAPDLWERPRLVLAPNAEEAERLVARAGAEDDLAARLATEVGDPVAVRAARTVVTRPDGHRWETSGPVGLGAPGSGDVLVGVLGGLLARGLSPLAALGWAVALHERAGAICARATPVGYLARDIAHQLPAAYKELTAAS